MACSLCWSCYESNVQSDSRDESVLATSFRTDLLFRLCFTAMTFVLFVSFFGQRSMCVGRGNEHFDTEH